MLQNTCACAQQGNCAANGAGRRKKSKGIRMIGILLIACLLISLAVTRIEPPKPPVDYIAVVDIAGTMSVNDGGTYDQQYLLDTLDALTEDDHNKGLLLHIDSPGGVVYQIDELYLKLMHYKEETGRPVYAAVESYAASGGYYAACAADEIYANRNSITGSIGVIMGEYVDLSEFLDKLGVKVDYITSGPNKSMGNNYKPMTDEQRAIYQSICDEYYGRFLEIVADSRGMDVETVRPLADGRIYTATQAMQAGLIDGIEPYEDTLNRIKSKVENEDIAVQYYNYHAPATLLDYLSQAAPLKSLAGHSAEKPAQQDWKHPQIMMYYQG